MHIHIADHAHARITRRQTREQQVLAGAPDRIGSLQQHARTARIDLANALEVEHDLVGNVNQPLDLVVGRFGGAEEQRTIEFQHRDPRAVCPQRLSFGRWTDLARSAPIGVDNLANRLLNVAADEHQNGDQHADPDRERQRNKDRNTRDQQHDSVTFRQSARHAPPETLLPQNSGSAPCPGVDQRVRDRRENPGDGGHRHKAHETQTECEREQQASPEKNA